MQSTQSYRRIVKRVLGFLVLQMAFACSQETGPNTSSSDLVFERWDRPNSPTALLDTFEARLEELPRSGRLASIPWSDSYWPSYKGGLAWRWQLNDRAGVNVPPLKPQREKLQSMSRKQISLLSPAEKFDIMRGDYSYGMTESELARTAGVRETWPGLCHGWAAAAYQFDEPRPVDLHNEDGITVPFGSADIKALLSFAQQYRRPASSTRFLGLRCDRNLETDPRAGNSRNCRGVNAGSFHLVIANFIGVSQKAVIMDLSRGEEVWNYPVFAYKSRLSRRTHPVYEDAAPGTESVVEVQTTLQYMGGSQPMYRALGSQARRLAYAASKRYRYLLELDRDGAIIGGKWLDGSERPEFMWLQTKVELDNSLSMVKEIYEQSLDHSR